jgi:hypothetical protein
MSIIRGFKSKFAILIPLGLLALAGCSDDTLAERKKACAQYANSGVLPNGETQRCLTDEQTFRKAAGDLAAADLSQMYQALVNDAKAISASTGKADLTSYPALPLAVEDPTFSDNAKGAAKGWPAALDLANVTFGAPDNVDRQWQIRGNRAGDPEAPWMLDLDGFGPTASSHIESLCAAFDSNTVSGCRARVYVKNIADGDSDLEHLVAVAIELTPPPRDEAYQTLLGNEMALWPPRQASSKSLTTHLKPHP